MVQWAYITLHSITAPYSTALLYTSAVLSIFILKNNASESVKRI